MLVYGALWLLAVISVGLSGMDVPLKALLWVFCVMHVRWVLPRHLLLSHPTAITGIKCEQNQWFVYSKALDWQAVRLCKSSVALPLIIVLKVKARNQWFSQALCIPKDALASDSHRRLRVRLKFSRQRWTALK